MQLTWETASEIGNDGFGVERQRGGTGEWTNVGFVEGRGTTTETQRYQLTDADLPFEAQTLQYRLRQVDRDGAVSYSGAVEVTLGAPQSFALHAPFPNPGGAARAAGGGPRRRASGQRAAATGLPAGRLALLLRT